MRVLGSYALVYLLDGSGRMRAGKGPVIPCRAGDLIFVHPELPQGYGAGPGEVWHEYYLIFNGPVFDLWRQQGLFDQERLIQHLPRISHWLPRLEAVVDPRLPDTAEGMLQRVCRLQKFLSDIVERPEKEPDALPWLSEARARLMKEPGAPAAKIAADLGVSYETFRKDFARHVGSSPGRYRSLRLIEQARVLMTERHLSNKEIAETLGFYDEFHFSRRFREMTGKSPREFRKGVSAN